MYKNVPNNKPPKSNRLKRAVVKTAIGTVGLSAIGFGAYKADRYRREYKMEQQISVIEDVRFQKFMTNLIEREGGFAPRFWIGDNTSYGVTETTLKAYKEKKGKDAEHIPNSIVSMRAEHALEIYKNEYYDASRIGDIKNESIAEILFDITVNHSRDTRKKFVKEGFRQAYGCSEAYADTISKSWSKVIDTVNTLDNKEGEAFYNSVAQARIDFFNRPGYIKKYKGLHVRAESFVGRYEPNDTIDFYDAVDTLKLFDKGR